jgi:four helix bundle protein
MRENIIKVKSFDFALEIIQLSKYLTNERREFIISKQVVRSGTAVGALIRESEHAESKKDFIHKLAISLKEANETEYWIELLFLSKYIDKETFDSLNLKIKELLRMLISIIKTTKLNLRN